MSDIDTLNMIHEAPSAKLTQRGGAPLSGLGNLAAAVWMESDYRCTLRDHPMLGPSERVTEHESRARHARMIAILAMLR